MPSIMKYREKHRIVPKGEEGSERCAHDGFRVRQIKKGWRHDSAEIERSRPLPGPPTRMQTWEDVLHEMRTGEYRATGMIGRATD